MTPDQLFKRWVHRALVLFAVLFIYFLGADLWMPVSTHSRVMHPVVRVAPEVGGQITAVHVINNQPVQQGDVLFTLDKQAYQLAVTKAELAVKAAVKTNQQLDASIITAKASVAAATANVNELSKEQKRLSRLLANRNIGQQQYDQIHASYLAALAVLEEAKSKENQATVERGLKSDQNLLLKQAENNLADAKLALYYTDVRAKVDGIITNLQLVPGNYASAGAPVAAVVSNEADIIADFREKSLSKAAVGNEASVIFDSLPGQVYDAHVVSVDAGVKAGQLTADGNLAEPAESDRWIRDAQYMRIHLTLDQHPELLASLPTGARSTVQLYPVSGLAAWLGHIQAHLISWLHYVY